MGAAKVLAGLAFLIIGIVLFVIAFVPIPGLEDVSVTARIISYVESMMTSFMTLNLSTLIGPIESQFLYNSIIIPMVAFHFCKAGIKSMRYDKGKKEYYFSETKIGLLIAGFILVCVAAGFLILMIFDILDPSFQFIVDLIPTYISYPGLLPHLLIPIVLTMAIVFFVYWIGSKIMKSGVKKEEMF